MPNSSYPTVDLRRVAQPTVASDIGRLYFSGTGNDLYFIDPDGVITNILSLSASDGVPAISGGINLTDPATITAVDSHLILSSSAGSRITVSGNLKVTGQSYADLGPTSTPTGTTQTIDWNDGMSQTLDLESASGDVTLTLSNPQTGASYILKIIQDSAVARNVVWPAAVIWPDGVTPTISTGADAVDVVSLFYDGTNYLSNIGQNYS